jgi:hypothetical protein
MFGVWSFVIDLTFACLREAASAKAGILKFGINSRYGFKRYEVSQDDEG